MGGFYYSGVSHFLTGECGIILYGVVSKNIEFLGIGSDKMELDEFLRYFSVSDNRRFSRKMRFIGGE